jgi:hypothetical protein
VGGMDLGRWLGGARDVPSGLLGVVLYGVV